MTKRKPGSDRTPDLATVLPFAATVLLMPPLLNVFAAPLQLGGIPLIVVYVFAVWAAIVGGAFLLARGLAHAGRDETRREAPDEGAQL